MAADVMGRTTHAHGENVRRSVSNFDYGKWERTPSANSTYRVATTVVVGPRPKAVVHRPNSTGPAPGVRAPSAVRGLASAGRQIWGGARQAAKDEDRAERIRLIQLRIQARKRAISDFKRRYIELIELNEKLRNAIEREESGVHEEVKSLLRKYEKFRGGISLLNSKFSEEFTDVGHELSRTQKRVDKELEALRYKVHVLDTELQIKQKELSILANYKDKEYPVKTIQMNDLKKEMETLTVVHDDEQEELKTIIGTELGKMQNTREQVRTGIIAGVTEDFLGQMHPSLQDMALQNLVMKKEMDFHQKEIEMLLKSNKELERKVNGLKRGREISVRMQLFPQLYPLKPICTPDMEVVLDIPKQEWLPI